MVFIPESNCIKGNDRIVKREYRYTWTLELEKIFGMAETGNLDDNCTSVILTYENFNLFVHGVDLFSAL